MIGGIHMWYNLLMVTGMAALMAIGFAIYIYYQERKRRKTKVS